MLTDEVVAHAKAARSCPLPTAAGTLPRERRRCAPAFLPLQGSETLGALEAVPGAGAVLRKTTRLAGVNPSSGLCPVDNGIGRSLDILLSGDKGASTALRISRADT